MAEQLTQENFLGLPDILPDIYCATSSLDVVDRHIRTLESELNKNPRNINALFMKNAFTQYYHCVSQLGEKHRQLFFALHQTIVNSHSTLCIKTMARTKSVLRFYQKCRRHLFFGKTIYDISDIFAGRIIIDSAFLSEEELIEVCYEIANETVIFMLSQGYLPVTSSGVNDVSQPIDTERFPDVVIPKESILKPEYKKFFKDYIGTPKTDSLYQSIHAVFANSEGQRIELQIRTYRMDDRADNYKLSSHEYYEEIQDKDIPSLCLDRTRVQIPLYSFKYGKLHDDSGFEKSSACMQETHRGGPLVK